MPGKRQDHILVHQGVPYFFTQSGSSWTPVGQNDALCWPDLQDAYRRKNIGSVKEYFRKLEMHGVNCIRVMLEYCQYDRYFLEKPAGHFRKAIVEMWDDLFSMAKDHGVRMLLTPYDTFWMWKRWAHHPYNSINGGPCKKRGGLLSCPNTRMLIKNRLQFATERWGSDGTIFGWDLWNEIKPSHANNDATQLTSYVQDVGSFLKETELKLHGISHLQTVSVFGHEILSDNTISAMLFRNPNLDFASTHFYERGTIDHPKNTIDAAIATGRFVEEALVHIKDDRPFMDTEHGPIYSFTRRKIVLEEQFDNAYFENMQWAHLASGACGGGMRWPYRIPHVLTNGMRNAQRSLVKFSLLVDWHNFKRENYSGKINVSPDHFHVFACADGAQAIVFLLRKMTRNKLEQSQTLQELFVSCSGMKKGNFEITLWDCTKAVVQCSIRAQRGEETLLKFFIPPAGSRALLLIKQIDG